MARALKSGCTSRKAHQTTKSRLLNSYKGVRTGRPPGCERLRVRSVTDFMFVDAFMSEDDFMSMGAVAPALYFLELLRGRL